MKKKINVFGCAQAFDSMKWRGDTDMVPTSARIERNRGRDANVIQLKTALTCSLILTACGQHFNYAHSEH